MKSFNEICAEKDAETYKDGRVVIGAVDFGNENNEVIGRRYYIQGARLTGIVIVGDEIGKRLMNSYQHDPDAMKEASDIYWKSIGRQWFGDAAEFSRIFKKSKTP